MAFFIFAYISKLLSLYGRLGFFFMRFHGGDMLHLALPSCAYQCHQNILVFWGSFVNVDTDLVFNTPANQLESSSESLQIPPFSSNLPTLYAVGSTG